MIGKYYYAHLTYLQPYQRLLFGVEADPEVRLGGHARRRQANKLASQRCDWSISPDSNR